MDGRLAEVARLLAQFSGGGIRNRVAALRSAQQLMARLSGEEKKQLAIAVAERAAPELVERIESTTGADLSEGQVTALIDMFRRLDAEQVDELVAALQDPEQRSSAVTQLADEALDVVAGDQPEPSPGRPGGEDADGTADLAGDDPHAPAEPPPEAVARYDTSADPSSFLPWLQDDEVARAASVAAAAGSAAATLAATSPAVAPGPSTPEPAPGALASAAATAPTTPEAPAARTAVGDSADEEDGPPAAGDVAQRAEAAAVASGPRKRRPVPDGVVRSSSSGAGTGAGPGHRRTVVQARDARSTRRGTVVDGARLATDLGGLDTAMARLTTVRRALADASRVDDVVDVVRAVPDGWERRRVAVLIAEHGLVAPADGDAVLATLARASDRRWLSGALDRRAGSQR